MSLESYFQELRMAQDDEPRSLQCIYSIICHVLGREKASVFATFVLYPPPRQALVSDIYLESGKSLQITKQQRAAMIWSKLERQGEMLLFPGFDTLIINEERKECDPKICASVAGAKTIVGLSPDLHGQDGRVYRVLPQYLGGDYSTWTLMQDFFSYPSPFGSFRSLDKKKICDYLDATPGYKRPLNAKLRLVQLLEHYYRAFRPGSVLKRKLAPRENAITSTDKICSDLRQEKFQDALQGLEEYCTTNNVSARVLRACMQSMDPQQEVSLLLDGCCFRIRTEEFPQCKFYTNNGFLKPQCPSRWNVAIVSRNKVQPVFDAGIWMPDEAIVMSRSKRCFIPQLQIWSSGNFVQPRRLWMTWKKYSKYAETGKSIMIADGDQTLFGNALCLLASITSDGQKDCTFLQHCPVAKQINFLVTTWNQYVETKCNK
jgi:hypothetical protein